MIFELLVQIHLAAVRLIRDTDHVGAIRQQLRVLGKLMNRGEKDSAAVAALQQVAQVIAALDTDHRLIADVALAIGEQARELIIQIRAVGDQHYGRARRSTLFINNRARNNMVKLLPQPVAPK